MAKKIMIPTEYFKEYRQKLGFSNQTNVKKFFGAKDVIPSVDLVYMKLLNKRLCKIVDRINTVVSNDIKLDDLALFKKEKIGHSFEIMKKNKILPILNNLGRRPEHVYFSWMRGFIISSFFLKALGKIFEVNTSKIVLIGDDDLRNIETFKKTPKADLEIKLNTKEKIRIEMQSGFTGTNDIKQHKVLEAKRAFRDLGIHTLAIHFDLYNGQAAFIKLDKIEEDNINWITRQQMEGQTVFNINQNSFLWKITERPVKYKKIKCDL